MHIDDKQKLSFGRLLRSLRRAENMTMNDVFRKTRVSHTVLELIEKEDYARLPAMVLVKSFLRSYANAVGADPDEIIRLYLLGHKNASQNLDSEASPDKDNAKLWPKCLLVFSALAALIYLTVFIMQKGIEEPPPGTKPQAVPAEQQKESVAVKKPSDDSFNKLPLIEQVEQAEPEQIEPEKLEDTAPEPAEPKQETLPETEKQPEAVIPEKLFLKIISEEETWFKVIIDNQDASEYTLKPGESMELEALSGYNILIGNAAGLKLFLNDKPVEVPGKSGEVVTIRIP
jgi:cytoskeletal protein RodZ